MLETILALWSAPWPCGLMHLYTSGKMAVPIQVQPYLFRTRQDDCNKEERGQIEKKKNVAGLKKDERSMRNHHYRLSFETCLIGSTGIQTHACYEQDHEPNILPSELPWLGGVICLNPRIIGYLVVCQSKRFSSLNFRIWHSFCSFFYSQLYYNYQLSFLMTSFLLH